MRVFGVRWRFYRTAEPPRGLMTALILFVVFAAAVYSGVMWSRSVENSTTFWAANGVLAAGLLLLPRRLGWAFAAACIGLNVVVNIIAGLPPIFNAAFTGLNLVFSVAVVGLVRTFCGAALDLGRLRRFLPFVGLVTLVGLAEGAIGALMTTPATGQDFLVIASRWMACDVTGMILGLPATLMVMRRINPLYMGPAGRTERLILLAALGAGTLALFSLSGFTAFLLTFPALVFAAFRLGSAWTFLAVWLMAQAATVQTLANRGPIAAFQGGETFTDLVHLQLYVVSLVLAAAFATSALAERMRAEHRMRRKAAAAAASHARVEQMSRTRERFLAVVSHEIRTPLNGILGFTGALAQRTDLPPEARRQVEMIGRSTDDLMTVVEDILDFSRLETGRFELEPAPAAVLDTLICAAEPATAAARARGLTFHVTADAPSGLHLVDARRLRQVVANLADHAVKFTEAGSVELRLTTAPQAEGDRFRIEVLDTGPGVPAHRRAELFQPFCQMDASISRRHEGTGLGLAICQSLVARMGGEIGYAPREEGGACFWVTLDLPRAEAAPAGAEPAPSDEAERAPRILIVDDHPVNREVARLILGAVGCDIAEAESGFDAVEAASLEAFDVILMDIRMPGMDGLEATRAIRARGGASAHAPILAVTADVMREDVERCRAAGMNGHVPKPLNQARLIGALQTALSGGEAFPAAQAA